MIDWVGGTTARQSAEVPKALNAPLFRSLVEPLESAGRQVVMDLGAATNQTIGLMSQYPCRLDIADLPDSLERLQGPFEHPDDLAAVVDTVLPRRQEEPIDIVLCWDVLNYLPKAALAAVMAGIAARARPGARAHALIYYSDTHMPEQPGTFVPLPDCSLVNNFAAPASREAPRYTPDDLTRAMPAYRIERAMLLGNGMQEFLFSL